jgi:phosphopantothenoylcysteine decarboxylase
VRIILGMTGSVASVLYEKLITELQTVAPVDVIVTEKTKHFVHFPTLCDALEKNNGFLYQDLDEWTWKRTPTTDNSSWIKSYWEKNDPVLHIDLRDRSGVLVVAPCSANTLAKLANGLTDNLLTSVARAWDMTRLKIVAPAMNTHMWEHPATQEHIKTLENWGWIVIPPQSKMLACGTEGMGAMANISDIVDAVKNNIRWCFPIWYDECKGIPVGEHQGAFAAKRKYSIHTGVDLYVPKNTPVRAVEDGRVVCIEQFTGPNERTPWWLDTDCVLIEGTSGVVCYGEIQPWTFMHVGARVRQGELIGHVLPVLPDHKFRPDIDGHMVSMLHMELYPHKRYKPSDGYEKDKGDLRDPTPWLFDAKGAPTRRFVHPKPETT